MKRRLDYDRIAGNYDRRYEGGGMRATARALQDLARACPGGRVLEVGCGTGRFIRDLSAGPVRTFGLDRSAGMLLRAQHPGDCSHLVQGDAKSLPYAASSFDLVYCVNAIHHFDEPQTFIREAGRVLGSGGILAVAGSDPRDRRHRWYLYDYFDGTYETDLDRFPAWDSVRSWMAGAGFVRIESRLVERIPDSKEGRDVLSDPFLKKDSVSQLALLSDEAYARGIGRISEAIDAAERAGESISFKTEILIEMLVGTKLGLESAADPQVAGRPARGSGTKPREESRGHGLRQRE